MIVVIWSFLPDPWQICVWCSIQSLKRLKTYGLLRKGFIQKQVPYSGQIIFESCLNLLLDICYIICAMATTDGVYFSAVHFSSP